MAETVQTPVKKKTFISKLKGDRGIWVIIILLALISIASVYSSSSSLAFKNGTSTFSYLLKQMGFVIIGLGVLIGCYIIPLGWYRKASYLLLAISAGLLLYTIFKGVVLNSASRWINIGPLSFQPSELAKVSVVLYLARILEVSKLDTFKEYVLEILLPIGVICLLCLYGSVSATMIIAGITFIILLCAGIKWNYIWKTIGIVIVAVGLIFLIHHFFGVFSRIDTFEARIERFFSNDDSKMTPEEKKERADKDFQSEQAIQAIQLGGIIGRGPGNSIKRDVLPHPYSDFIYANIVEEWGLLGGILVMMLYIWFFYRCIIIAKSCKKTFSTIVVLGLALLIVMQAVTHILVNIGIFPVTGQTLPMISLGGTSLVIMSCAFGIILSVNRTIEITIEKEAVEQNNELIEEENNN